jgi:xanthine/uracil permease
MYPVEVEDEGGGEMTRVKVEHGERVTNLTAAVMLTLGLVMGEINFHGGRVSRHVQPFEDEGIGTGTLTRVHVKVYFPPFH